jgi:hypothetical protein
VCCLFSSIVAFFCITEMVYMLATVRQCNVQPCSTTMFKPINDDLFLNLDNPQHLFGP